MAIAHDPTDVAGRVVLPMGEVGVDPVTSDEVVDHIVRSAKAGIGGLVVTPNIDHLRQIHHGDWLGAVYARADVIVADGMPLVWAARLQGTPVPARVAGSELLWSLAEGAAKAGVPIYLLGGAPGAAEQCGRALCERHPGLRVVGTACPPFGFERSADGIDAIARDIRACEPGIVFTALGAPKQDLLNAELHAAIPRTWFLGVGAAVDMAAGIVDPAPTWARRRGLEWAFRLVHEPRRLARRYLVHGLPFAARLLLASAAAGRSRRRTPA